MEKKKDQVKREFEEAYELYSDLLFKHCYYRVSSREVAIDLVQECFIRTWKHINKGNDIQNLKSFLYRVVNNLVIDYYRKKKSDSLDSMMEEGFDPAARQDDEALSSAEYSQALTVFEKLPDQYKTVMIMRFVDDLPVKEIAEMLGESENTVSVRIHRGLEKTRQLLGI